MGEDQVFLSRLKISQKHSYFAKKLFYNYFVGHKGQLTKDTKKILEVRKATSLILRDSDGENGAPKFFVSIIIMRQILTLFKSHPLRGCIFFVSKVFLKVLSNPLTYISSLYVINKRLRWKNQN